MGMMIHIYKSKFKPLYESACETCGIGLANANSDGRVYFAAYAHARKGHRVFVRCITEVVFEGVEMNEKSV